MLPNNKDYKPIRSCLLAVYNKKGLQPLAQKLQDLHVKLYATVGTCAYLQEANISATEIDQLTQYPEMLGGRVKTLHPKIFGGLLYRSQAPEDLSVLKKYQIPRFDMLIVNLYPFEAALQAGEAEEALIEKIDIGGVALLRAGAKNFKDIWVLSSPEQYAQAQTWLERQGATSTLSTRRQAALEAFHLSSHYDTQIFSYFNRPASLPVYKQSLSQHHPLRYGENPHQKANFYGSLSQTLDLYQGPALSYNNVLDIEAAFDLLRALGNQKAAFVIIKHSNPCGVGVDHRAEEAYQKAYASDSLSAFGGVFASNRPLHKTIAAHMSSLFFEAILAPDFSTEALHIFSKQKNRRVLRYYQLPAPLQSYRSALGGMLEQETDLLASTKKHWEVPTSAKPKAACLEDLQFAYAIVACARSNAIALAKAGQLLGCGTGQTSRIDALHIAIEKAKRAGLPLQGAVMASEAFFPFPDCVEIAHQAGIKAVIQPGGSKNDKLSINYCEEQGLSMTLTHQRHFKH